jgi:hypothetical protein
VHSVCVALSRKDNENRNLGCEPVEQKGALWEVLELLVLVQ